MLEFQCSKTGFDCPVIFRADTQEELDKQIAKHAIDEHDADPGDLTPEFHRKVRELTTRK